MKKRNERTKSKTKSPTQGQAGSSRAKNRSLASAKPDAKSVASNVPKRQRKTAKKPKRLRTFLARLFRPRRYERRINGNWLGVLLAMVIMFGGVLSLDAPNNAKDTWVVLSSIMTVLITRWRAW